MLRRYASSVGPAPLAYLTTRHGEAKTHTGQFGLRAPWNGAAATKRVAQLSLWKTIDVTGRWRAQAFESAPTHSNR